MWDVPSTALFRDSDTIHIRSDSLSRTRSLHFLVIEFRYSTTQYSTLLPSPRSTPLPGTPPIRRRIAKMGREDQVEEREVLDSIFPDEITGELLPCHPDQLMYEEENLD